MGISTLDRDSIQAKIETSLFFPMKLIDLESKFEIVENF